MHEPKEQTWRLYVLLVFLGIALAGLLWRLVDLNIIDRSFLLRQSKARVLRRVSIPAYRGMITDRSGTPLAISTPVEAVWANPKVFKASNRQTQLLAGILKVSPRFIRRRVAGAKKQGLNLFIFSVGILQAL